MFKTVKDSDCFILTTDADVKFTPESVEALLDRSDEERHLRWSCMRTHLSTRRRPTCVVSEIRIRDRTLVSKGLDISYAFSFLHFKKCIYLYNSC